MVRTNKAELHHPRPFGFDAPAQAKAGIGRSWTETGGAKPGFRPNRYRGFVGFSHGRGNVPVAPNHNCHLLGQRGRCPSQVCNTDNGDVVG